MFQYSLFDEQLQEFEHEGVRYITRRNPVRAKEMQENRASKLISLKQMIISKNKYLMESPRASMDKAKQAVESRAQK